MSSDAERCPRPKPVTWQSLETLSARREGTERGQRACLAVFWAAECHSFLSWEKALQLPASPSAPVRQPVRQYPCHPLADGHHLGRSQPPVHIPTEHAGPPGDD